MTDSSCDKEAGPPLPQSSLTKAAEPDEVTLKAPPSKDKEETLALKGLGPSSLTSKTVELVSATQEKDPPEYWSLPLEAQVARPAPA